ncbi:hypothetical protein [Lactococcus ileimucosae]|uniref:hypothetical protein n=1 Tax=Lactococcus ileimucosae TaxID=2941329 RepID=UPI003516EA7D
MIINEKHIKKLNLEPVSEENRVEFYPIVAFQMIEMTINYYGCVRTFKFDTKIMDDGRQFIIDGNGFVDDGTEIA